MVSPHLERMHRRGRRAHPELALERDVFAARLAERPADRLAAVVAEDMFLATACEVGVPGAWERLVELHRARLETVARAQGLHGADVDEVVGSVLADLALPGLHGTRTRLGAYDGTGRLATWLGIQVVRATIRRRAGPTSRLRALDRTTPAADDPVADCVDGEDADRLRRALAEAWPTLKPRERLAVTWKIGHALPHTEIARLLGVGPPRVSRIVERAVRRLRDALGRSLPELRGDPTAARRLGDTLRDWLTTSAGGVAPNDGEGPDATD